MENNYDAIVVGAGPGGVTVASLLANSGKRVLLADKNPKCGGRMMTVVKDGFHYELFPINCVPQHNSLYEKLSGILGKDKDVTLILGDEFGYIGDLYFEDGKGVVRKWRLGASPIKMITTLGIRLYNIPALLGVFMALKKFATMPKSEYSKLYQISARDYFDSVAKVPEGLRTYFLATFAEGVFEMTSDKVPASEMIKAFQVTVKGSGGRYYEGGIGHFFDVMSTTVEENGGMKLMNTRVKSIDIENGKAAGITTESGEKFTAPLVISDAGIRQTAIKLAGEEHFEKPYIDRLKKLENNLACVGFRYFTDAPVLDVPMAVYYPAGCVGTWQEFEDMQNGKTKPKHNYIYLGTTSLYKNMAPAGKQVIYAVMSCTPDTKQDLTPYLEYIEARTRKLCPKLYDHIERTEIMTPGSVVGVGNDMMFEGQGGESYGTAISVGQAGPDRPSAKSPVEGLYYVGNDVEGSGLGTHLAVESGFKVFEIVTEAK